MQLALRAVGNDVNALHIAVAAKGICNLRHPLFAGVEHHHQRAGRGLLYELAVVLDAGVHEHDGGGRLRLYRRGRRRGQDLRREAVVRVVGG